VFVSADIFTVPPAWAKTFKIPAVPVNEVKPDKSIWLPAPLAIN